MLHLFFRVCWTFLQCLSFRTPPPKEGPCQLKFEDFFEHGRLFDDQRLPPRCSDAQCQHGLVSSHPRRAHGNKFALQRDKREMSEGWGMDRYLSCFPTDSSTLCPLPVLKRTMTCITRRKRCVTSTRTPCSLQVTVYLARVPREQLPNTIVHTYMDVFSIYNRQFYSTFADGANTGTNGGSH